jgi:PAS domain S-box-containing protein
MSDFDWVEEFPGSVIISDPEGIILAMNAAAAKAYAGDGGKQLIGTNMLDCHPEPARSQVAEMLRTGLKNVYTTERKGIKKLIYQSPWYKDGEYAGFVEMSLEIPAEMPHFIRG